MQSRQLKTFAATHKLLLATFAYSSTSASLAFTIFLRLLILPAEPVKYLNSILYYLNYYVIGSGGGLLFILFFLFRLQRIRQQNKKIKILFMIAITTFLIALEFSLLLLGVPEFIALFILVPLATVFYISQFKPKRFSRRQTSAFLGILITFSFLLPPVTAHLCFNSILSQASTKNEFEKSIFISDFIRDTNLNNPVFVSLLRANGDFQKYLMIGVGYCEEMAMAASNFLNSLEFDSRVVHLPGEDHAFTEFSVNGTWFIIDPGYYMSKNLTREQRANDRIREMGAISYVVTYANSSYFELTQYYVPTDLITIRVVNKGVPIANAQLYLEHTFQGRLLRLPDASHAFETDENGTVTIHLGALSYNDNAARFDSFYRIFVNGIDAKQNVTSLGLGKNSLVEIDMGELQ